jgi:RNA polymerase sigma-70 factor (ECF subfamily)
MQYDYDEIADIVGKSSTNCRQIFARAKRGLGVHDAPDHWDRLDREKTAGVVEQFMNALASGDAAQMMKFLSADAVLFTDGGGKVKALAQPLHGHERISDSVAGLLNRLPESISCRIAFVSGLPGIVLYRDGSMWAVMSFEVVDGRIAHIYFVANPDKLANVH